MFTPISKEERLIQWCSEAFGGGGIKNHILTQHQVNIHVEASQKTEKVTYTLCFTSNNQTLSRCNPTSKSIRCGGRQQPCGTGGLWDVGSRVIHVGPSPTSTCPCRRQSVLHAGRTESSDLIRAGRPGFLVEDQRIISETVVEFKFLQ